MEAITLIKAATECRKKMHQNHDGERAVADLYLQASLKFLHTGRLQEECLMSGVIEQESTTRWSHLQNYTDGALTLDQCVQIYERFKDYAKAALCYILLGVAKTTLQSALPTTAPGMSSAATYAFNWEGRNGLKQMPGQLTRLGREAFQGLRLSHVADPTNPNEPRLKDPLAVGLFASLRSAHERFSQGSTNIPPMPDSWIKASRYLSFAEAAGAPGDTRYKNSLREVRKMGNMAIFGENSDRMLVQAYVAIDALSLE
ncbi:hypothetical protein R1flu_025175 [Riccia fluitans]|uniref:CWZF3/5/7 THD domain-containing protein n=1 Tax=Riccia fluitans TaxID=41844 RepID=A0ABD1Y158_9MARC